MPDRAMITQPQAYFDQGCGRCDRFATPDCSTRAWLKGLLTLRRICRDAGLTEVAKWGHPCYMHAGRNIAIMGAFRGDYRLTFMNAALLKDSEGLLERQGPNTKQPDCIRFTDTDAPTRLEPAIRAYLAEAMAYADQGLLPPKEPNDVPLPDELVEALDGDPDLAEAFAALTPGRQKSWAFQIGSAKTAATRVSRIEKGRAKIMAGEGATDR
ncbi:YdeI family protein [Rhodobacter sp. SY28-1]|uniref:YdeI/OmpD-associated family protein n=1 Tax=Rhodobacter sp. SY28-1 TaxID=2562317 RepID=UPI001F0F7F4F|nr:YdeI/OmpD-associated family protein [Rhodobacter sp. SY28-1]